jgi:membrane-associated phospholipid phosphatase
MTRTICGILFIALPTYNIRPEIINNDIFSELLKFLYHIDSADNLFPSIHCLVSWNCFVGIRGLKYYGKNYKIPAFIIAILVFISTLVTKQHVIVDIISAVVIAELCWYIVNHTNIYKKFGRFFNMVNDGVFGRNSMRD